MDPDGGQLQLIGENTLGEGTALSISEVFSGGYIILGNLNENFILHRTDPRGQIAFSSEFNWTSRETTGAAIGTSDGGYAIFGSSEAGGLSMMVLIKTDVNGEL
jgi:hypothetical protein